jgi:hypothetical protein
VRVIRSVARSGVNGQSPLPRGGAIVLGFFTGIRNSGSMSPGYEKTSILEQREIVSHEQQIELPKGVVDFAVKQDKDSNGLKPISNR